VFGSERRRRFTLIVILGVIGIIAIPVSVLLPSIAKATSQRPYDLSERTFEKRPLPFRSSGGSSGFLEFQTRYSSCDPGHNQQYLI